MKRLWIPLSILSVISLTVLYFGVTQAPDTSTAQPAEVQEVEQPATVQGLLEAVNAERAKVGIAPLVIDERLNQSAQRKADEMIATGEYGHVNAAGVHGYEYARETTGQDCNGISENLTGNDDMSTVATLEKSMNSWLGSTPHREAMLDPKYTSTGFGVTDYAVVQHFCRP